MNRADIEFRLLALREKAISSTGFKHGRGFARDRFGDRKVEAHAHRVFRKSSVETDVRVTYKLDKSVVSKQCLIEILEGQL